MSQNVAKNRRARFAVLLAGGETITAAAKAVKINRRTATRWLKQPAFTAKIDRLRARMVEQATAKLSSTMAYAADKLKMLLDDADPRVRLGACRSAFEFGAKLRESTELETRLTAVEATLEARPHATKLQKSA